MPNKIYLIYYKMIEKIILKDKRQINKLIQIIIAHLKMMNQNTVKKSIETLKLQNKKSNQIKQLDKTQIQLEVHSQANNYQGKILKKVAKHPLNQHLKEDFPQLVLIQIIISKQ